MDGKMHYDKAETLLETTANMPSTAAKQDLLDRAQVHATLALTQATLVSMERVDWQASITVKRADGGTTLDTEMVTNDALATSVKGYLKALLRELWREEEGFDSKRPFGNSSWQSEVYRDLVRAGLLSGELDEDGSLVECDYLHGEQLMLEAIEAL